MADLRQHFESMSSEQLTHLLREDCAGRQELPLETLILICNILAERDPHKTDVKGAYRRFIQYYLPKE